MRNQSRTYSATKIYLIGIPILIVIGLLYLFTGNYAQSYKPIPLNTIIYDADKYEKSSISGWHTIDLNSFTIDTPTDFRFFLQQGIHGGTVGGLTNAKDTINFVYGAYYFDACEGVVKGEIIGRCDTLQKYRVGTHRFIITGTDESICAFSNDFKNNFVFKAWADPEMNLEITNKIFKSIKFND